MAQYSGSHPGNLILLHGGAGPQDPSLMGIQKVQNSLKKIGKTASKMLNNMDPIIDVVVYCLQQMEKDPLFNAGIGSALQADGMARVSASLMDGSRQIFSGVASASYISFPSILAKELQKRQARVLTNPGAELLARELNQPINTNLTEKRSKKWLKSLYEDVHNIHNMDTVGCVIKTADGKLIAGSSTGGRGYEYPGRVSDTSSIAGNYSSKFAAIAVTGIGEEIMDDAVAPRIETRIRDGKPLNEATNTTFKEAKNRKRKYGWIAIDKLGNWNISFTTYQMPFIVIGDKKILKEFTVKI